jgi:ABC-type glycerol-3-phosphate transport system substrate-binding protein
MTESDWIVFTGCPTVQRKTPFSVTILRSSRKISMFLAAPAGWVILVISTFFSAGCQQDAVRSVPTQRYAGIVVRVAVPNDPSLQQVIDRHGTQWAAASGAAIQKVEPGAEADVVFLRPWELGQWAKDLLPIDVAKLRGTENYEYSLLLREHLNHTLDWAGQALALPVVSDPRLLVYRTDLLGDPRHLIHLPSRMQDAARRLNRAAPPVTWQECLAVAEYFSKTPDWSANDRTAVPRPSLPPLPDRNDDLDREFHLVATSFVRPMTNSEKASLSSARVRTSLFFNYQFDAEDGNPLIDSPGFVAALRLLQQLQAYRSPTTMEPPIETFRRGQAVWAVASLADVARLQAADSPVRGKFGVSRIPGSREYYDAESGRMKPALEAEGNVISYLAHGGWIAAISRNTTQPQVALDWLAYLSSPRISLEIVAEPAWGAGPTRGTHLDSRSIWHNYDLDPATTNQLIDALESTYRGSALNPVFRLRIKDQSPIHLALVDGIRQAIHHRADAQEVLLRVAAQWKRIIVNKDEFRREYRASVGLK